MKGVHVGYNQQICEKEVSVDIEERGTQYRVRTLSESDAWRLAEYQRLRGITFVQRLGWQIPVDSEGREVDRYDRVEAGSFVSTHCVYGVDQQECLLGGVRILTLRDWSDSMVENEFHTSGMIPEWALQQLKSQYRCTNLLEVTRLCVQPTPTPPFRQAVARDLVYASAWALAQATDRAHLLVLVDALYFQIMRRGHWVFQEIYSYNPDPRHGHVLMVIDLWRSIRALRAHGKEAQAARILALCA